MDKKEYSISRFLELPDYVTLLGAIFSILSMLCSINHLFSTASILLILSAFCDYFDGKIARAIKRKHTQFGEALDNVVDSVSFAIAPIIFGYSLGLRSPFSIAVLLIFASACFLRLARFNCIKAKGFYIGMPVTYNNLIFPLSYLILRIMHMENVLIPLFLSLYLVTSFLMTSRIVWRKF